MCTIYGTGLLLPPSDHVLYISSKDVFTEIFVTCSTHTQFFSSTKCHVFHNIIFLLVNKIFTFYMKSALKIKCPNSSPRG